MSNILIDDLWFLSSDFPKKREKDYTIKIRNFPHSTKQTIRIFYQKETKSDIKRQIGTIRDKSRHCAWARCYLCITSPRITRMNTDYLNFIVIQTTAWEEGSRVHPHVSLAMCYRDPSLRSGWQNGKNNKENNPCDSVSSVVQKS